MVVRKKGSKIRYKDDYGKYTGYYFKDFGPRSVLVKDEEGEFVQVANDDILEDDDD